MTSWISWSLSSVLHLAILLALALWSVGEAVVQGPMLTVQLENTDLSPINDDQLFDFSSVLDAASPSVGLEESALSKEDSLPEDLAFSPVEPSLDFETPSRLPQDLYSVVSRLEKVSTATFSKGRGQRGGQGANGIDQDGDEKVTAAALLNAELEEQSHTSRASFFGTSVAGKKFVFVVDSSRSMTGPRWRSATFELMRFLHELMSDTEFFIICFDETDHPVFGQSSTKNFLVNDPKTLDRTQKWIESRILGRGTYPSSALSKAVKMAPDAIFLLSDGVIQDDSIWMLRKVNHDKKTGQPIIPIHTILLLSPLGRQPLEIIALENGGTFKDITIQDLVPE